MRTERTLRRPSDLSMIFNWNDERGRGRCCMLASAAIVRIIQDLTTGTLYTAFLTVNNFSIVDAGIISVLPLLASCFAIFSPYILERFPRRKWVLAGGRLTYYLLINVMAFLGQLTATVFLDIWGSRTVLLLGYPLSAVQILLMVQAVIDLAGVLFIATHLYLLEPDPEV